MPLLYHWVSSVGSDQTSGIIVGGTIPATKLERLYDVVVPASRFPIDRRSLDRSWPNRSPNSRPEASPIRVGSSSRRSALFRLSCSLCGERRCEADRDLELRALQQVDLRGRAGARLLRRLGRAERARTDRRHRVRDRTAGGLRRLPHQFLSDRHAGAECVRAPRRSDFHEPRHDPARARRRHARRAPRT